VAQWVGCDQESKDDRLGVGQGGAHVDDSHSPAGRVADRESDQIGVEQLEAGAWSVSFRPPCQVAQTWLQHDLGPLQLMNVVPYDLLPTIGMPVSHVRGQALDPLAHASKLAKECAGSGHNRTYHGRSVRDVYPDVVDTADVVAVEIDDAVVDQVAANVH
jgi:hypothetical protein